MEMTAGAQPPRAAWPRRSTTRPTGNPFFVGEVVRLLASEGRLSEEPRSGQGQIPQGVREVVGRRLDRLSDAANEALKVAAVIGREFDAEVVAEVSRAQPRSR